MVTALEAAGGAFAGVLVTVVLVGAGAAYAKRRMFAAMQRKAKP